MTQRFQKIYRLKKGDDIGQPGTLNAIFQDIDRRLDGAETTLEDVENLAARVESAALTRINEVVTPIVVEATNRVASIPALFTATSVSAVTVGTGTKTFIIEAGQRNTFAPLTAVSAKAIADPSVVIYGTVVSYSRVTGELVVDASVVAGSGSLSAWSISAAPPPDVSGAGAAASVVRGGVASERDTLKKISDALNDAVASLGDDIAAAVETALAGVSSVWRTGDSKLTLQISADPGWVMMNDGSIGSPASGATTRANDDCNALFLLLYGNLSDTNAPIQTSAGSPTTRAAQGTAAAAWAANCRLVLPRQLGRSLVVAGAGAGLSARLLGSFWGSETKTIVTANMPAHNHGINDPGHGHSVYDPTHYHSYTAITITGDPNAGSLTGFPGFAYTYTENTASAYSNVSIYANTTGISTQNNGSGTAFDVTNPSAAWNIMIKL